MGNREKESLGVCTAGKTGRKAIDHGPNSERFVNADVTPGDSHWEINGADGGVSESAEG
jgi:hypothetical protein